MFARIFMFVLFRLYMYDMDNVYVCIVLTKWSNKKQILQILLVTPENKVCMMEWGTDIRSEMIVNERRIPPHLLLLGKMRAMCVLTRSLTLGTWVTTPTSWTHVAMLAAWAKSASVESKAKTSWNLVSGSESG